GSRPSILKASAPTSRTSPVYLCIATADGSSRTTPRSGAKMSVLTVPRSIAKSSVKMLVRMFITSPTVRRHLRGESSRSSQNRQILFHVSGARDFRGFLPGRPRAPVSFRDKRPPWAYTCARKANANETLGPELNLRAELKPPLFQPIVQLGVGDYLVERGGLGARDLFRFGDCTDADCEGSVAAAKGYPVAFSYGARGARWMVVHFDGPGLAQLLRDRASQDEP